MQDKENKLNLTVTPTKEGVVTILHGDADPAKREALPIKVSGNITAVSAWVAQQPVKKEGTQSFVVIDVKEGQAAATIVFYEDGQSHFGSTITGNLQMDPDLKTIGVNSKTKYRAEALVEFLKLNRFLFPDRTAHQKLIGQIAKFDADITQKIQEKVNDRGNRGNSFSQTVAADVEPTIELEIPIFKGEAKAKFLVDIAFNVTDGDVVFWLESAELKELIEKYKKEILDREVKLIQAKGITVVYQ